VALGEFNSIVTPVHSGRSSVFSLVII